ncbi:uncharacterized protein LOC114525956 [Dendronephthya gigantea]|uniref:uncharacterized protein LOC114525956 n=1 Tax=Dendronephthya gigantea TaxID=151771 RepID=UPI001068FF53|nr:uncharacterized protein LOC114525956 [Dendronephthya gigantea]
MFDEVSDLYDKYENDLLSLRWVEEYYIGVASEPEKSWQIYITCAKNKLPSMKDLKKLFGVNIASFVDFCQEDVDRTPQFTRGPASGNEVFNPEYRVFNHGSIGVVFSGEKNHYATTSYHVCYNGRLPKDISKAHQILKDDCENGSPRCQGVTCLYVNSGRSVDLGSFNCGLYDDNHDIALLEMNEKLNCSDMVNFLKGLNLRPDLADIAEVKSMFYEGHLPVERVSPEPRRGVLFGIRAVTRCPRYKRCYKIKGTEQDSFASQGDSGSLIYLIYERENIPFAYLSFALDNVFHARNLKESVKELVKHNGRGDFINVNACITQHNNFQN